MEAMTWLPYEEGKTIGTTGSEEGVILRDEEYAGDIRITLEQGAGTIPFAITCGISGWMAHTCYCGDKDEADNVFEEMKVELTRIYDVIPYESDPDKEERRPKVIEEMQQFINRF